MAISVVEMQEPASSGMKWEEAVSMAAQSAIMVLVRSDRSFFRKRITEAFAAAPPGQFSVPRSPHKLPGTWHDTAPTLSARSEEDRVRSPQCRKHLCLPWCPVNNLLPEIQHPYREHQHQIGTCYGYKCLYHILRTFFGKRVFMLQFCL